MILDDRDRAMAAGEMGEGPRLAMRIIIRMAEVAGAERLLDITRAHIDGCLYHGRAGLDFAERLAGAGAHVAVPTTLNVTSLDLLHPELYRGDQATARLARRQMDAYEQMGCRPTWTCAPYQLPERPHFGEQIAWAESNAIVFANSVLGARTNRYGDFIDICAAITGRVPASGLHLDDGRRGRLLFRLVDVSDRLLGSDVLHPVLGHLVGEVAGTAVPVIDGLRAETTEDQLKALGAAAASSGAVALVHVVGVTPEAPTVVVAMQGAAPERIVDVGMADLRAARDALTTATGGPLTSVNLGTPHASVAEFGHLFGLLAGRRVADGVELFVNTGRDVLSEVSELGWLEPLQHAGVQPVTDTCTYITPILSRSDGVVMTDSGKWAHYAPGNLGVEVVFGSTEECVESAVAGRVVRDEELWR